MHAQSINSQRDINILSESELDTVYNFSLQQLKTLYKDQFLGSEECKQLILELHNNIIEFRFLQNAGFIDRNGSTDEDDQ